jgi:hypothetical protein
MKYIYISEKIEKDMQRRSTPNASSHQVALSRWEDYELLTYLNFLYPILDTDWISFLQ